MIRQIINKLLTTVDNPLTVLARKIAEKKGGSADKNRHYPLAIFK